MKKITFFVHGIYKMGGTEKVVILIANELSKKYNVEIISLHREAEKPFYKVDDKVKIINVLERDELKPIKLYYPYFMYKVRKALKNYKTDIFICAGVADVALTTFMRKKAKFITWEHFNALEGKPGGVMWLGRKLSTKFADKIVVLTKRDMELNKKRFHSDGKIVQIYNPIEMTVSKAEYDKNSKKIVTAGRLTGQKGLDMLIDIAEKVFSKHPDWEWHIYGDGPMEKELIQKISEKKLEQNVKLMGRTNKMNEIYPEYAMYVMTSRYEGFAMVNIEAHFAKLPIVSFNCNCGPDEIIQDGVNGYVVDCFDIDKMAEKINTLIENPDLRIEMSQNTMLDKEKLDIKNIIKEWEKIL